MADSTSLPAVGLKDTQTATPAGQVISPMIDGVSVRSLTTLLDARGEICELVSMAWPEAAGVSSPHVYLASVRTGIVKGWIVHRLQTDRLSLVTGTLHVVLYDGRPDSPTFGTVREVFGGDRARMLVVIPPGVWHAVRNVGETEGLYVNAPDLPYDHENPDKCRLPIDTDRIPYSFDEPRR